MKRDSRKSYNQYMNNYMKNKYKNTRKWIINFLGGKCKKCNSFVNLHIDHIDKTTKQFSISRFWSCSKEKLKKELKKCQLLCEDCHNKKSKKCKDNFISIEHYKRAGRLGALAIKGMLRKRKLILLDSPQNRR